MNQYDSEKAHPSITLCNPSLANMGPTALRFLEESYFLRMQQVRMDEELPLHDNMNGNGNLILNNNNETSVSSNDYSPFSGNIFSSPDNNSSLTTQQQISHEDLTCLGGRSSLLYRQDSNRSQQGTTQVDQNLHHLQQNLAHQFTVGNQVGQQPQITSDRFVLGQRPPTVKSVDLQAANFNSRHCQKETGRNKKLKSMASERAAGLTSSQFLSPNMFFTQNFHEPTTQNMLDNVRCSSRLTSGQKRRPAPTLATGRKSKDDCLPPEEDEKRRLRRERNKVAAAKCRRRRADLTKKLEMESEDLTLKKQALKQEIIRLTEEREKLRMIILAHRSTCPPFCSELQASQLSVINFNDRQQM